MIYYSYLRRLPISLPDGEIAHRTCDDCIIDFTEKKVVALLYRFGVFKKIPRVILWQDILSWNDSIRIRSEDDIANPVDIVRIASLFRPNRSPSDARCYSLISVPARAVSGMHLGSIVDFACDELSGALMQYHVGSFRFFKEPSVRYIIPDAAVRSLSHEQLIVYDDTAVRTQTIEETEKVAEGFTPEPA